MRQTATNFILLIGGSDMGTGVGKDCGICGYQLNYDDGFNLEGTLCNDCEALIPKVLNYIASLGQQLEEIE